jgi:hypothetical protein
MNRFPVARAALAYWAWVFAAGFALGTVRTLWLAPRIGPLAAVAAELPIMLAISWNAARRVIARHVIVRRGDALAMGALALALLLLAEAALARVLGGQGVAAWAAQLATPHGELGLAGQALFALIPAWLLRGRG